MDTVKGMRLWALDTRCDKWGAASVLQVEEEGGKRMVRIRYKGFSKKYDETIEVGGGRLRPHELGPPGAHETEEEVLYIVDNWNFFPIWTNRKFLLSRFFHVTAVIVVSTSGL